MQRVCGDSISPTGIVAASRAEGRECIGALRRGSVNLRFGEQLRGERQEFIDRHLYTVLDNTPAEALITDLGGRFKLYDCNGCDVDIGRALGADRTLTAWVQKVSNLILNINIQIRDVKSGLIVLTRSVDIRGNTDVSWLRGVRYMTRSIEENRQGNR